VTAPEWRDCADPDELAAAVAAGVEVLAMGRAGDFPTANQTADQFAGSLRAGITYQLPPPAPPWPGAVLSGLCDEDGVPTWLAQAPNVQGEAVRTCVDFPWFICGSDNAVTPYWVEVRAPRAVPEPETERVPWWESVGRVVRDATGREAQILRADVGDGAGPSVYAYHDQEPGAALRRLYAPVNGFGTVEVLKDGGQ
jgi:hypothetical protein